MTRLFGHSIRSETFFLTITDVIAVFCLVFATTILGTKSDGNAALATAGMVAIGVAVSAILVGGAVGLYRPGRRDAVRQRLVSGLAGSVMLLVLIALVIAASSMEGGASLTLQFALATLSGAVVAMSVTRIGMAMVQRPARRIALIGTGDTAALRRQYEPFEVTLAIPGTQAFEDAIAARRFQAWNISTVVVTDADMLTPELTRRCDAAGLKVLTRAEFLELGLNKVDLDALQPGWLNEAWAAHTSVPEAMLRRAFDIAVALSILLFTLPLMLAAMLAIRLDGPGPILYRQERIGLGNRPFTLFKFRSMVVDAEKGGAPKWASRADPRVTRVGRFLRLTRIDEIPQVLNVLRGDMSVVGPRPERPAFVEQLAQVIPHYNDRAVVKPGITGWAQVSFPYGASVEDSRKKLEYDLYYVRRRSLFLDLLILLATVRVVLFQEGAR